MKKIILTMAFGIALIAYAQAQTITWNGAGGDSDWNNGANWDTGVVPTATDDVLIYIMGTFVTVDLSTTTTIKKLDVKNALFTVTSTGNLTCAGATADDGLETSPSGMIVNDGMITISTSATNDIDGLYTKGTFTNNGIISITGAGEHGVRMAGGSFTNNVGGMITVTGVGTGDANGDGFYLDDDGGTTCLVTNNGTITVNMTSGDDGVYLKDGSIFDNAGTLTIDCSGGNDMGLHLVGASTKFTNSGNATITDAPDFGVQIDGANVTPACSIDNSGFFTVNGGPNNGTGNDGVRLRRGGYMTNSGTATFSNTGDDSIQIDDSAVGTAGNDVSTFDNFGTIDISGSTDHGMDLFGYFNNKVGATFKADACTDDGIQINIAGGFGLFTNDGHIMIDNSINDDIDVMDASNMVNSATATFEPGSSPGDLVVRDGVNFGSAVITFEINGTSAATDYDQVRTKGTTMTDMTLATAKLVWGYTPSPGDCFKIVDGDAPLNFTAAGAFAGFDNTQDPSIAYTVDYLAGAGKEVLICVVSTNNDCDGAAVLANNGPGTLSGQSFSGATSTGPGESCDGDTAPSSSSQNDLWYKVNTDNNGGELTISAEGGASSDLVLALYDGCGGTQLDCEDSSGENGMETITFADPAFQDKKGGSSTRSDIDYWIRIYEKSESGSDFVISASGTALPVNLIGFTGINTEKGSQLKWQTATEINNEGFEIERSINGFDWTQIGYTKGHGDSHSVVDYTYLDETPAIGTNYYRLKQIDFDGRYDYSNIVTLETKNLVRSVSVYPNPVKDILYIDMDSELESVEINLYDSNGRVLWANSGAVNQIPFEEFNQGIYLLEIVSASSRTIQKIVK